MDQLAQRLIERLIAGGAILEEDAEIYHFGFLCLFSDAVQLAVLSVLSAVLRCPGRAAAATAAFAAAKRSVGGWHMQSRGGCLVLSTATILGIAQLAERIPVSWAPAAALCACALAAGLTVWRAPRPHPNNPKRAEELPGLRRQARRVVVGLGAVLALGGAMAPTSLKSLPLSGSLGLCAAASTLLIPVERGERG